MTDPIGNTTKTSNIFAKNRKYEKELQILGRLVS